MLQDVEFCIEGHICKVINFGTFVTHVNNRMLEKYKRWTAIENLNLVNVVKCLTKCG